MIPLIPVQYRVAAYASLAALLIGATYIKGRHDGKYHEQAIQAEALAKAIQARAAEHEAALKKRDESESSYLQRIRYLEEAVSRPVPVKPVRLCHEARSASLPKDQPTPSPDAASPSGEPILQAGPDIGPELVQYGATCERLRIQLDELQKFQK